ncbi:hypothetical protein DL98DRAFT_514753 [Cadophora sp. DSE1049]|nr:hypothetical protein DL98DRAFT_514753 [Cadophora sp. DSE1049]
MSHRNHLSTQFFPLPCFPLPTPVEFCTLQNRTTKLNLTALTSTFILPSHRKSNLGTALVQLALARAKELSLPLFLCSVPSARGFYLKSGFTDVAVGEVDLGAWGPEFGGFGRYRLSGMVVEN